MLKFIFWCLLALNAALLAYGQGWLGNFKQSVREPGRIDNQLNRDRLKLLGGEPGAQPAGAGGDALPPSAPAAAPAPAAATAAAAAPAATPLPASAAAPSPAAGSPGTAPALVACTLVGNFAATDARRFEALLAPLELGDRQSRENLTVPEVTSYIVFIPPHASKEAADRKAEELKNQGVSNYFIMNDTSPMKWAISLGVFKSENAANTLLAALNKRGVSNAKVAGRTSQSPRLAYRIRNIDAATKARLDAINARFPEQEARACT